MPRTIRGFALAALTSLATALPATASAAPQVPAGSVVNGYAIVTRNETSTLVSLDFNAPGSVTPIGPSPNGATIWGTGFLGGKLYALGDSGFYTIDVATGALARISDAPSPTDDIWGMTVDPTTQTLYWIGGDFGEQLSTIDPATGATTFVAAVSGLATPINITAIAVDADGQLYGIEQQNDNLVRIDKVTGASSVVGPLGVNALFTSGLAFDPSSGTLYFSNLEFAGNGVYRVDKTTGQATLIDVPHVDQDEVDLVGLAIPATCRTGDTIFCNGFEAGP
ncbi:DUF6923 family protein [Dokdonella ginsengisoli]|uniref:DUF6923 family protein n=1 Tax=Dokdonella ginsengisoli TaxID=363846 RepID=A0ABV9QS30_9GAMM